LLYQIPVQWSAGTKFSGYVAWFFYSSVFIGAIGIGAALVWWPIVVLLSENKGVAFWDHNW
jgi:hypothetical protein